MDEFYSSRFAYTSILFFIALIFFSFQKKNFKINLLDLGVLGFYLINIFSLLGSHLPSAGFIIVQGVLLFCIGYFLFRMLLDKISAAFLANCFVGLSALVCAVTTWNLLKVGFGGTGLTGQSIYQVTAFSAHKNLLSSFLFLLLGFTMYYRKEFKWKIPLYMVLVWVIISILMLRSRAVYLALFAYSITYFFYLLKSKKEYVPYLWNGVLGLVLLGIIGTTALTLVKPQFKEDLAKLNPANYLESASGMERLFVWYKTTLLIQEKPFTGYGAGNWRIVFPKNSIEGGFRLQDQNIIFTRVHNDFLEVFAETGMLGFLVYLGFFIFSFHAIARSLSDNPKNKERLMILLGMLSGYLIISILDFPKERIEHQIFFAFLLGLIVKNCKSYLNNKAYKYELSKKQKSTLRYSFLVLLLPSFFAAYFHMKGEFHTVKAIQAKNAGNWSAVIEEADKAFSPGYQIDQVTIALKWYKGIALYNQQKYKEAIESFKIAKEHTPYNVFLLNDYGSSLVQLEMHKESIVEFEDLLFINPRFEEAMFNISFSYSQVGDYEAAIKALDKVKKNPEKKIFFLEEIEKRKNAVKPN